MTLYNELTVGPLSSEIAPYLLIGDSETITTILNRKDIPSKKEVSAHDIRQYLMLNDLLIAIEVSTQPSCVAAARALEVFPLFDLSNEIILNKFSQVLDGLVAEATIPNFTSQHKNEILALGDTLISRAEQVKLDITELEVRKTIWSDTGVKVV